MSNPFTQEKSAHWYTVDGEPRHDSNLRDARKDNLFFSVTTVLKMWPRDMLDAWKQKNIVEKCIENPIGKDESPENYKQRIAQIASDELAAAAAWGRQIHRMFEYYGQTGTFKDDIPEEFQPYIQPITDWFSENVKKVIFTEQILTNKDVGYAGTCDIAIESTNWGRAVCDFKRRGFYRGKPNVYDTDPMQLEAYARCLPWKADNLVSVGVNRDAPEIVSHVWKPENRETFWKKFQVCFNMCCMAKNYAPMIQYGFALTDIKDQR